jgi:hypothetical protein
MANTIKTSFKWQYSVAGTVNRTSQFKEVETSTTSDYLSDNTQNVGTTHELVSIGDVTDDAMVIIENLHATATVEVGGVYSAAFSAWLKIPAGAPAAVLPRAAALASTYLKSSSASTPIRVTLVKIV